MIRDKGKYIIYTSEQISFTNKRVTFRLYFKLQNIDSKTDSAYLSHTKTPPAPRSSVSIWQEASLYLYQLRQRFIGVVLLLAGLYVLDGANLPAATMRDLALSWMNIPIAFNY